MSKRLRVNQQITSPTVRLVDDKDEQIGIVGLEKALELAEQAGLDLAEVAPKAKPPVCKILDYGKYQYHQKKIEQKHRKMQKKREIKGVRISYRTEKHDLEVKMKQAKKFLEAGHMVKVTLMLKGREMAYLEYAKEKLDDFAKMLEDVAQIEQESKKQGYSLTMILSPLK